MNTMQKLQIVQTKLKAPKGQFNAFGKYKYRSLEDIMEAVKPLLAEVGAYITITDEIICVGSSVPILHETKEVVKRQQVVRAELLGGERFYVKATAIFTDGDKEIKTEAFAREPQTKKGMDESQITGSASSYARKYALNGLLAIDDTRDADSTNTHGQNGNVQNGNGASKRQEPKATEPAADVTAMIEQAFFNFETEWKDDLAKGFAYDKEKFKTEIRTIFVGLTSAKKKTFKWTSTSIAKLAKKVDPSKVISEIKAA